MKEEDDVLLSRYLAGDLPEAELRQTEQRLGADSEFAEALRLRRQEEVFLRTEADLPGLQARMSELAAAHFPTTESAEPTAGQTTVAAPAGARVRRLSWLRYAAGGAVAAMLVLLVYLFDPFGPADPYGPYAQYEPLALTEKSDELPAAASAAEAAFNRADYAAAYPLLTDYLAEAPDDNQARLALGIAALETDRDVEALALFTALAEGTTSYRDDGQFYRGYALLRADRIPEARAALQQISAENPDFGVRARELLQLIED